MQSSKRTAKSWHATGALGLFTLLPQLLMCLLQTEWLWNAPLTLSWILGVTVAGLGWSHSAPTLLALHPQQSKSAAQVSSGSLLTPAAASMQSTEGPSTPAVPAAVADPALAAGPTPADTPMLPAEPLLMPPDFPDPAVSSAMCLWAEDVDIPVAVARQAILYVHANFVSELSQHPSADCLCLSKPLQELVGTAVRAVTDAASFHLLCGSDAQSGSSGADPALCSTVADGPSMPST